MRVTELLPRAVVVTIGAVTAVWTAIWLPLFLWKGMGEAMAIGIFPTLMGVAMVVWILLYRIRPIERRKPPA